MIDPILAEKSKNSKTQKPTTAKAESSEAPQQLIFKELLKDKNNSEITPDILAAQEQAYQCFESKIGKFHGSVVIENELIWIEGCGVFPLDWLETVHSHIWADLLYEFETRHSPWAIRPFQSPKERKAWRDYKRADEALWSEWQRWEAVGYRGSNPQQVVEAVRCRERLREKYLEFAMRPARPEDSEFANIFEEMEAIAQ